MDWAGDRSVGTVCRETWIEIEIGTRDKKRGGKWLTLAVVAAMVTATAVVIVAVTVTAQIWAGLLHTAGQVQNKRIPCRPNMEAPEQESQGRKMEREGRHSVGMREKEQRGDGLLKATDSGKRSMMVVALVAAPAVAKVQTIGRAR